MDSAIVLGVGVLAAAFVGVNIGGSSTAAAFGPSVGSGMLSKVLTAALMTGFVFVGGWTVGRRVVRTLSEGIVPASTFTLQAGVVVLVFVGCSLLLGNWIGIPASTSETTVGAIVGLGLATQSLRTAKLVEIVVWWVVSPVVALLATALIGRYCYQWLEERLTDGDGVDGDVIALTRDGWRPRIDVRVDPTGRRGVLVGLAVLIGCYMAFSAGASNVANAVAPVVGQGSFGIELGILVATGAIGIGAFTIARRTLEVLGDDLARLSVVAALVVEVVAATLITFLSAIGIPASLSITTTCSIIGLNLGRSRRRTAAQSGAEVACDGGRVNEEEELLNTGTTWRSVGVWVMTPTLSAAATFVVFSVYAP